MTPHLLLLSNSGCIPVRPEAVIGMKIRLAKIFSLFYEPLYSQHNKNFYFINIVVGYRGIQGRTQKFVEGGRENDFCKLCGTLAVKTFLQIQIFSATSVDLFVAVPA